MEHTSDKHPKQDFQVERLAFFSDAVFAIAITLLIIEFKVPHITKDSTYAGVLHELAEMKVHLMGLLFSYFLIAVYWIRHHFLYKYIHNYNRELVAANMVSLLPIIFLPFSTAFLTETSVNPDLTMLGMRVFFLNHFAAGISIFALYWLGAVRHKELSYEIPVKEKLKFYEQTLFSSMIFAVLFAASFYTQESKNLSFIIAGCVLIRVVALRVVRKRLEPAVKKI